MFKKYGLPSIITVVFGAIYYYFALPVINFKSSSFWGFLIVLAVVFFLSKGLVGKTLSISAFFNNSTKEKGKIQFLGEEKNAKNKKIIKRVILISAAFLAVAFIIIFVTSSKLFHADKYQKMLSVNLSSFNEDIAELPLSQIPVVDRDTAERLGSRKIGEVVELVSQFDVTSYYTQINYRNTPVRVSPLQYADIIKWFTNKDEGVPYYVKIDMATQDTELVKLDQGMKYAPCEYFSRDLTRHIRFAYPTKMVDSVSFEIDDNKTPYWIVSCYDYTIGILGGYDITSIIMVNAVTGEMKDYDVSEVPQWVDCVYTAKVALNQANYWGAYKNGYWNSIISQKGVVKTTDGYNYLAINDDIWVYTGVTSVVADESNIGFLLVNLRTKEAKQYEINGAEEYSAMESAEGKIQEKGYTATFPILVNIADTPSYFISLKDSAGLVKAYSFVSVSNYQIVGVADTLKDAEAEYRRLLSEAGKLNNTDKPDDEVTYIDGNVTDISSAVIDGNTCYFIKLEANDKIFIADVSLWNELPFIKVGDSITISYVENDGDITVTKVEWLVFENEATE